MPERFSNCLEKIRNSHSFGYYSLTIENSIINDYILILLTRTITLASEASRTLKRNWLFLCRARS